MNKRVVVKEWGEPMVMEDAPALPGFDVEVVKEPESAEDRVAQWQRKLLDLTTRNRLLHLPPRSKHVPLSCPDPSALEDLLAEGGQRRHLVDAGLAVRRPYVDQRRLAVKRSL